jgi:hypothetical protein
MKKLFLLTLVISFNVVLFAQDNVGQAAEVSTVEQLLMLVKEGKTQEQSSNAAREAKFMAENNKQATILAAEKREFVRQEKIADQFDAEYKKNEEILRVKEEAYQKDLGSLVELFDHVQSSAGDAAVQFSGSLTSAQYGLERVGFLNDLTAKMSEKTELPTIREIEGLWYELQREMVASGQVVSFDTTVVNVDGKSITCNVTRVGLFNAVCDGKYLEYVSSGEYAFLPRQPAGRYTKTAKNIGRADTGEEVKFGVDPTGPTGGSLLANLIQTPSLAEKAQLILTPSTNANNQCDEVELFFKSPQDGYKSSDKEFKVEFGSKNVQISPAGVMVEGLETCVVSGHHHLIINNEYDVVLNSKDPIPYGKNILHFGGGQTEAVLSLSPGKYVLQLALGDYEHMPVKTKNVSANHLPLVSEKITIEITSD